MNQFLTISGIVLWIWVVLFIIYRLFFKWGWLPQWFLNFYVGKDLVESTKKVIEEAVERRLKRDSVSEFTGQLLKRLTRIGVLGIAAVVLPLSFVIIQTVLLYQQNELLTGQNKLIDFQNTRIDRQTDLLDRQTALLDSQNEKLQTQNDLFLDQNHKVDIQTQLSLDQNDLFREQNRQIDTQIGLSSTQNELLIAQNTRIDTQNYRLNLQNNLLEADRRSSLVFLMSNVLDKVDEEIRKEKESGKTDSIGYRLSDPLIARIIGLSRAFQPYKMLEGDTLGRELVSPERGQLFIALMESHLDSFTQNTIVERGSFNFAVIGKINLSGVNFRKASLRGAIFHEANFENSNLEEADLSWAFFKKSNFTNANLTNANLTDTNLKLANLSDTQMGWASLYGSNLSMASFKNANLQSANLVDTNILGADFRGANLSSVRFHMETANVEYISGTEEYNISKLGQVNSLFRTKLSPQLQPQVDSLFRVKPCLNSSRGCVFDYSKLFKNQ